MRLPSDVVTDVEARHLQVTQPSLLLEGHMNDSALRIQVQSPLPPAPLSCAPVSPLKMVAPPHSGARSLRYRMHVTERKMA